MTVRARARSTSSSFAISRDERFESFRNAVASSPSPSLLPTTRRSARAVPPVASAASGSGGTTSANDCRTTAAASASSRALGGSWRKNRLVKRSEPMSTERDQVGPLVVVPTTSCAEPPPTSQTATVFRKSSAAATAPNHARDPSSSASRTRTSQSVAWRSAARRSLAFTACRPGDVTRTTICPAPSLRALRTCVLATTAAASSFSSPITPSDRSRSSPRPSCRRSSRIGSMRPRLSRVATRRRNVFAPTSTTPTLIGVVAGSRSVGVPRQFAFS